MPPPAGGVRGDVDREQPGLLEVGLEVLCPFGPDPVVVLAVDDQGPVADVDLSNLGAEPNSPPARSVPRCREFSGLSWWWLKPTTAPAGLQAHRGARQAQTRL